ncbi:MAG: FAD-dependent oxidoreductase [Caldilineaceae bacterium]|nr:FAD-dependent oxidoreductase [Caldilineaceae bacterium]
MQKFIIIGGDGAGMSAASKAKRNQPDAEVIVFERGPYISYSACGMPYWIGGQIGPMDKLVVLTPERARERRGIDVRIGHEVTQIDAAQQVVHVRNLETDAIFTQPYDKLVIATGARAAKPPIPGVDLPGVFALRSLSDGERIYDYLSQNPARRAVVIGGGYIGLEMAEGFRDRDMQVAVVEMLPQLLPNFDPDMVEPVAAHLVEKEVEIWTQTRVTQIRQSTDGALEVIVQSGKGETTLPADIVLVATGVRPNSELAQAAGLKLGATGAIWVDAQMRTSDPHIYAAGDCVEHFHRVLGENVWIPLAPVANRGGRVAGDNISGGQSSLPGIIGTAVVKVFDYTLAVTGLTENEARAHDGLGEIGSAVITSHEKAAYWPGAAKINVKLIIQKSNGRVIGGQLVGKKGVAKRIDVIATAITAGMTADDMAMLDLAYAPPYSPTYDPIQVCANVVGKGE